ncbi:hypothetical protein K461DRAFT_290408 [Myriangium duriaei CBS 260.36]|uniref:CPAF-like PDZ domain-containing protein n=1 Tax=Myriangium duriaei CBS 260.36 TaxID=1168546 RepID=A0A9P4JDJ1_9PEZI|nr:hypothetical protein K461DRAFT_290408 [Myriangium duriaei CBS 260.36]
MLHSSVLFAGLTAGVALAAPQAYPTFTGSHPGYNGTSVYTPSAPPQPTLSSANGTVTGPPTVTVTGTTSGASSGSPTTGATDACGQVAALSASWVATSPPSSVPSVPAQIAYECLNSIPFNQSASEQLLDSIEPFLNWQTTLSRLGNPPADYATHVQPPYDFYQTWADIRQNVSSGGYKSQYQFDFTLYRSFQLAHDGHFTYYPIAVNGLIAFGRTTPLVSVSIDGKENPQPYLYSDVLAASFSNASFTPSRITTINGEDAIDYLVRWSTFGSLQDPDALYNNLFYIPAQVALGSTGTGTGTFSGGGRGRWVYPGAETTFEFANGTCLTVQNYGRLLSSFEGIETGADLAAKYLDYSPEAVQNVFEAAASTTPAPSTTSEPASTTTPAAPSTTTPAPGYPSAIYRHSQNFDSGYFLEGAAYQDAVVIAANSFVGATGQAEFQQVIQDTLAAGKAAGKTKLIIDVSANAGGTILLGYDFFTQLFPKILPYGANRFRAHEVFNLLGEAVSQDVAGLPRSLDLNATELDLVSGAWNYRTDADVNYEPFTSWQEKYGPVELGPLSDTFTNIIRWNLSDPLTPINSGGIYVSGYLNRSNITTSPFASEDIVIVYDGYCASTCTIFSELMRQQGGVKTIALGGRSNTDIIQAVGGVKGTNDLPWDYIFGELVEAYQVSPADIQKTWQNSPVVDYNTLFADRGVTYVVNARDGFRQGDTSNTPLQFVYEPADCRILYTPEMVIDQSAVWRSVYDTVWGGENSCVAGGIGGNKTQGGYGKRSMAKRHVRSQNVQLEAILESFSVETENEGRVADGVMVV